MINKTQIWHHNNPKHYGEKKKSVTLFCWLFQFSGPMFFSLKSLAINKASLSLIKEIQVFRAVNIQQKYMPHIYLLCWHYACKHVSQMQETASQHLHGVPSQFISASLKISQREAQGEVTLFLPILWKHPNAEGSLHLNEETLTHDNSYIHHRAWKHQSMPCTFTVKFHWGFNSL